MAAPCRKGKPTDSGPGFVEVRVLDKARRILSGDSTTDVGRYCPDRSAGGAHTLYDA